MDINSGGAGIRLSPLSVVTTGESTMGVNSGGAIAAPIINIAAMTTDAGGSSTETDLGGAASAITANSGVKPEAWLGANLGGAMFTVYAYSGETMSWLGLLVLVFGGCPSRRTSNVYPQGSSSSRGA